MRVSRAVGRRIVALKQERRTDATHGKVVFGLKWIELDNGDRLFPTVDEVESGYGYIVELVSLSEHNEKERNNERKRNRVGSGKS